MEIKHEQDCVTGTLPSGDQILYTYPDEEGVLGNVAFIQKNAKSEVWIDFDVEQLAQVLEACGFSLEKKSL